MITDYEFYQKNFDSSIDEETFNKLNMQSQPIIEYLTRCSEEMLLSYSEHLDNIKKAICSQIFYLQQNGGMSVLNGESKNLLTSESYGGSYSYSKQNNKALEKLVYINGIPVAPMVKIYLGNTGLLYAGVGITYEKRFI